MTTTLKAILSLELTVEEAKLLSKLCSYNCSIPEAVAGADKTKYIEVQKFITEIRYNLEKRLETLV
jgi:biotin synthase-like enzyme